MKKIFLFLLLISLFPLFSFSQARIFDNAFASLKDETSKVDSLNKLCFAMDRDEKAIACELKVKELAEKLNYQKGIAQSLNNVGIIYKYLGKGKEALQYHLQALKIREGLGDKKDISSSYNNIGNTYDLLGNIKLAIEFHIKALKIREELKDTMGMARSLNNIGSAYLGVPDYYKTIEYCFKAVKLYEVAGEKSGSLADVFNNLGIAYSRIKDFDKALTYYEKALAIQKPLGNSDEIAKLLDNIAVIYHEQGQDTSDNTIRISKFHLALENYSKALDILSGTDNSELTATVYNNIGNTYWELNDFPHALTALNKSLDIYRKSDNKSGIASALNSLAVHYKLQKDFNQSIKYGMQALSIADSIYDIEQIKNSCEMLSNGYREIKQFEKSLFYYTRYTEEKDKLTNVEGAKKLVQEESKMIFEKQEQQMKAEQEKERIKTEEKSRRQKIITWAVVGGLLLVLVFSIFILNRWRITQKQKKIIEVQKEEVEKSKLIIEQHNKDVTDSIHYASRIQRALFTSEDYISKHLSDYFILFKPKDIVSGDFYWAFAPIESAGKKTFFFACCDCTGHGVPGAFMSLLNISFLNAAVIEKDLREPEKILNSVRTSVVKALAPALDGMDASLCMIDLKNKMLHVSCAMNPVWLIQNGIVNEIAPDKMPVGAHDNMNVQFKKHSIQLQEGDIIYAFTDGYADQFGGPKNKKFRYKQFGEVILENSNLPMNEQKEILNKAFEEWKGENEQVDDVLVIGIRIT